MTTVQFKDWRCRLYIAHYSDGNTALSMYDTEDGSAIACVSINLVDDDGNVEPELLEDRALIYLKDYSENEGMLDLLIEEGIVERTGRYRQSGYIEAPLVRIIDPELVAEIKYLQPGIQERQPVSEQAPHPTGFESYPDNRD